MNILQIGGFFVDTERIVYFNTDSARDLPISPLTASRYYSQESVHRPHGAHFYQILAVLEGSGKLILGGVEYPLSEGCVFYVGRGVAVEYISDGNLVSAFLTAGGDGVSRLAESYCHPDLLFSNSLCAERYRASIARIIDGYYSGVSMGKLSSLTYSFFVDFFEENNKPTADIEIVARYIEQNLERHLTVAELASLVGLSESGLSHKFKDHYSMSVIAYLIEARLRYARELLISSPSLPTKELAYRSGFEDVSYFCRAYKRRFGKTPRADAVNIL